VNGSEAADQYNRPEKQMIALFLLLLIVAIALGIVGVVAKGLLFLLIIGIAVFLGSLLFAALRMRRRPGRHPAR
jgi:1,4-dihydroxy-2-naphthoate octaprenyltransferase